MGDAGRSAPSLNPIAKDHSMTAAAFETPLSAAVHRVATFASRVKVELGTGRSWYKRQPDLPGFINLKCH